MKYHINVTNKSTPNRGGLMNMSDNDKRPTSKEVMDTSRDGLKRTWHIFCFYKEVNYTM